MQAQKSEEIRRAQAELNDAQKLMVKTKNFQAWKQAFLKEDFKKQLGELQRRCDRYKIDYTEIKLLAEDEAALLRQQQTSLRKLLSSLEVQCTEMQTQLDHLVRLPASSFAFTIICMLSNACLYSYQQNNSLDFHLRLQL